MERRRKEGGGPHCLVLSFPLQGHINPMSQFSKRLKHAGIAKITLVTTKYFLKSVQNITDASFPVETISDGFDDGGAYDVAPGEAFRRCSEHGSRTLAELVEKLRSSGSPADCVIYDPFYPWVLDVARKFGLVTAMFFTQPNFVNCIYFNAYRGELKLPVMDDTIRILPGGLPVLDRSDLPSFIQDYESDPQVSEIMMVQFRNVELVDWVFVNTFHQLEQQATDWLSKSMAIRTIGPTIPSMFLDKRIPDDDRYGLSIFSPITDPCLRWLDEQPSGSVVYVSFGSFATPKVEQIQELALALKSLDRPFLWVVRASEESKLPINYKEEITRKKGLIVAWCPQLQVLEHAAVGCFVTHCGWNSTLEALSLGVPMVAMPQWSEQYTNAKFVEDVWRMGIRAKKDDSGLVGRAEIARCVKHVTEGETGEEMRSNALKWKDLARKAVDEGGSSDQNIQEFVSSLKMKFC
ncbi:hypothetical protein F511_37367 [Dorcoceras hygrometricum]|uniref:Glycosyltransferase n=1 Tax=Dorcoceras hygrometricum TaxID=472368 RepID=A0A2Z7CWM2_9LAMI|nr:hypothetical protein F511_37367 [Dorcoceras hygrometricum]